MRNLILAVSATAMAIPATFAVPTDGAQAQRYYRYSRYYDRDGYYSGPTWRGRDGRYYCRRSNGTTGLIIGGAAGALVGRSLDGGRNHTTGTVIGAVAGALAGRAIERDSNNGRRCR
jgi:outer membrane lipoprotein SlyB